MMLKDKGNQAAQNLVGSSTAQGYSGRDQTLTRYMSQLHAAEGLSPARGKLPNTLSNVIDGVKSH